MFILSLYCANAKAQEKNTQPNKYGKDVISAAGLANNTGFGLGIHYERFLDEESKFSVILPGALFFTFVQSTFTGNDPHPLMFFFYPGFRYYPSSANGAVRYSLGVNGIVGAGQGQKGYSGSSTSLKSRSIVGVTFGNAIHFQFTKHIRSSLELDLGIGTDNGERSANGRGITPIGQFSFSLGYRS